MLNTEKELAIKKDNNHHIFLYLEGTLLTLCVFIFSLSLITLIFGKSMFEFLKDITSIFGGISSTIALALAFKAYYHWKNQAIETKKIESTIKTASEISIQFIHLNAACKIRYRILTSIANYEANKDELKPVYAELQTKEINDYLDQHNLTVKLLKDLYDSFYRLTILNVNTEKTLEYLYTIERFLQISYKDDNDKIFFEAVSLDMEFVRNNCTLDNIINAYNEANDEIKGSAFLE
ncbi:hypothetical protein ACFOEE_13800 [Pseudoalteromonas fenneropenaei]|uniref:Phage abortive infection protein n=1 Tax=Pseudoalteromonas fenneropenaei TaxID=1737459 RepID=A0ABV7CLP6_9GAMM